MRSRTALALMPLLLAGCISPFTSRLDKATEQATALNQQMAVANAKLEEATLCLERSEKKLDEANTSLHNMERRLNDMDRRFAVIELGFRKMLNIKGPEEQE
jgi:outer membrane murein-binding lipoprotein Lpp